jgi:cyclin B
VNDFILISDSAYTREQILRMEKTILNRLQWNLTVPTPYVFLVRFAKASSSSDSKNDKEVKTEYTISKFRCICTISEFVC